MIRLKPWVTPEGETQFAGWARMALPINAFSVVEVGQPRVGENRPSRVRADVTVDLNVSDRVKEEWEGECVEWEGECVEWGYGVSGCVSVECVWSGWCGSKVSVECCECI